MSTKRAALLLALPLFAVALAGCSAGSDAGGDSSTPRSESQLAADAKAWDVANAQCLRDAGIDVGDPSESGGTAVGVGGDFDPEAFQAAARTCREEVSAELGERPVTAAEEKAQGEYEEQLRESNACLRDEGYDAPDPKEGDGGAMISEAPDQDIPDDVLEACGAFAGSGSTGQE
ncbi:hypothetical protein [uncultured Frigoribacterium sp.]|uniref:hypothetical protein n=1 Tax=uncultured Frigoribacterium sp. TaxID=335377 RepID=UPI0028D77324|nr:hypothetical protein [uncultured Frigoribacterium sp.]